MSKMKSSTKTRLLASLFLLAGVLLGLLDFPAIYNRGADWLNAKANLSLSHFYELPFRFGLDLQGGTHLVYEADVSAHKSSERGDAMEGVRDVIERRVNAFGVAEPLVQVSHVGEAWRVIVELAGVKDVNQAIKMIGETPLLEFKEQNDQPARKLTAEEEKQIADQNKTARATANEALKLALATDAFAAVVEKYHNLDADLLADADGYIGREHPLFEDAEKISVGQVNKKVIEKDDAFYVLKVEDKRELDTEVKASHILICWQGAEKCGLTITKEEALAKIQEIKARASSETFGTLAVENSTDPAAAQGGDLGWFTRGQMIPAFEEAVFSLDKGGISEPVETQYGYHLIYKADERPVVQYLVAKAGVKKLTATDILPPADEWQSTGLTGAQLVNSHVNFSPNTNLPEVSLEFNDEGKELFATLTEKNLGKPIAIFLDGEPISIPRVNVPIRDGRAVIEGDFDLTEAQTLSRRLNAGALPVAIDLVSQQTVDSSLGGDSLTRSFKAGIIGLFLVALFMIFYYRLPGVLAVLSLVFYVVLVLFIFKLVPVTLTLAGMAGFILSVGMAVDANVLIFERLREELRIGKPLATAITEAFKRAWPSIRDGNVTTLLICLILVWFSSSMIKGFALTLSVGILSSMFTALVLTKQLLLLAVGKKDRSRCFGVKVPTVKS